MISHLLLHRESNKDEPLQDLSVPLIVSDFCLVKFVTEEDIQIKHYVGLVVQLHYETYEVSFLRKIQVKDDHFSFCFPNVFDVTTISKQQVISRLLLVKRSGTARQNSFFEFKIEKSLNLY